MREYWLFFQEKKLPGSMELPDVPQQLSAAVLKFCQDNIDCGGRLSVHGNLTVITQHQTIVTFFSKKLPPKEEPGAENSETEDSISKIAAAEDRGLAYVTSVHSSSNSGKLKESLYISRIFNWTANYDEVQYLVNTNWRLNGAFWQKGSKLSFFFRESNFIFKSYLKVLCILYRNQYNFRLPAEIWGSPRRIQGSSRHPLISSPAVSRFRYWVVPGHK